MNMCNDMKAARKLALLLITGWLAVCSQKSAQAATTINANNKFAYGANTGWIDWRGDTNNGAVIGEYVCAGYIWAANVGWIHLGSNAPANGIQYQNNSATDYGVNHDGVGNLRGFAWGANIGWINFENLGAAKVDLPTGKLSGSIYSANCGWISLSNAFAFVQTDQIQMGADTDGDGLSDKGEYLADTNPLDPNSRLRITTYSVTSMAGTEVDTLTWSSRPTRQYVIQSRTDLNPAFVFTNATGLLTPEAGATTTRTASFGGFVAQRYFRVQPLKPLP